MLVLIERHPLESSLYSVKQRVCLNRLCLYWFLHEALLRWNIERFSLRRPGLLSHVSFCSVHPEGRLVSTVLEGETPVVGAWRADARVRAGVWCRSLGFLCRGSASNDRPSREISGYQRWDCTGTCTQMIDGFRCHEGKRTQRYGKAALKESGFLLILTWPQLHFKGARLAYLKIA